ncbi:MAG: endolytic transglycosylase MltG [Acidobacteria bacterium]|nr:endolytic transglycosylase MltG [Acidobacteriota bacterium]
MVPRRQNRRRWPRTLAGILALLLLVFVGLLLWPYQGYEERAVVVIEQGLGRRAIADRLVEAGVLRARLPFLLYAYAQPHRTLKAGEYVFEGRVSPAGVFAKLARGEVHLYALVIPEGYTRWDIAEAVARLGLAPRQAILAATENTELIRDLAPEAKNLEGYLFPDTYRFARPADPRVMVHTMAERFRRVYTSLAEQAATPLKLTPHQLVTLASLVEKETGVAEERGLIAGVFHNRLARNWRLECDPTVIYAERLAKGGVFDGEVNVSDLERTSPYNTYLRAGLPPGPIASPGRAALEAALNPPKTNYLYFVSDTRGGHVFSSSGAEHARHVARYRRQRAANSRAQKATSKP